MISPRFWFRFWKARRALVDYPLYDVPHKQAEETLSEEQVQENFAYFMRVRHERLAFFQQWMHRNFGVELPLNGDGILALEAWLSNYGGGLVGDEYFTSTIFATYQPRWTGRYAGYNVMVDIAIFIGEYLISKRPRLCWEIHRGELSSETGKVIGNNLARPIIGGFPKPRLWKRDVFQSGYGIIADWRNRSKLGGNRVVYKLDTLACRMKTTLYLANIPDGNYKFIFGDYSNEPLE